jgi:hypothetical protein
MEILSKQPKVSQEEANTQYQMLKQQSQRPQNQGRGTEPSQALKKQ